MPFGSVTWALVARYGDLLVSERRPKNRQQLSVAVPKIAHSGAETPVRTSLRERQICRRILRNDLARRLPVDPGNQALKLRQLGQCTFSLSDPESRI